jgi:hypothetical protein
MLVASLSEHDAHLMFHAEQRTQDVCIEGRGVGFWGLFHDRTRLALRAGGVYSNIQTAIPLYGLVDLVANVILAAYIGANELCFAPVLRISLTSLWPSSSCRPETTT